MARRVARGGRISPFYFTSGPLRSHTLRYCQGDSERAERMRREWEAWSAEYSLLYVQGKGVPAPPHADVLDCYAKVP